MEKIIYEINRKNYVLIQIDAALNIRGARIIRKLSDSCKRFDGIEQSGEYIGSFFTQKVLRVRFLIPEDKVVEFSKENS